MGKNERTCPPTGTCGRQVPLSLSTPGDGGEITLPTDYKGLVTDICWTNRKVAPFLRKYASTINI